jgi:hypothetical protein
MSQGPVTAGPQEFSQVLPATIFTARFDEPMVPGKNVLWCATFQAAWDAIGEMVGGDPRLKGTPELATSLNRHLASGADLDEASYVAMAGFGRDAIIDRIKRALTQKFEDTANLELLPDAIPDDDILAYAYLFKNLEFAVPFDEGDPRAFDGGSHVEVFGITPGWVHQRDGVREPSLWDQVSILHYGGRHEFTIELKTNQEEDRLILARSRTTV